MRTAPIKSVNLQANKIAWWRWKEYHCSSVNGRMTIVNDISLFSLLFYNDLRYMLRRWYFWIHFSCTQLLLVFSITLWVRKWENSINWWIMKCKNPLKNTGFIFSLCSKYLKMLFWHFNKSYTLWYSLTNTNYF